ncbi:MAG TPA: winged helix DNA-binding domain-containing protein [Candidatus Bathyarchaeia archaeon]|nr:winged helix DNA-binding domain-containing protein [Candidatus Bathyarchaeia archaeon]
MNLSSQLDSPVLRALNRRLLASQSLSRKASGPRAVVKVAEACCGMNSQDLLESYSSFWARVNGFRDSDLTSELRPKGGLVRTWTVRSTMHTIPSKDYWVYVFGGPGRRFQPWFDRTAKKRGIPDQDFRVQFLYQPFLDHVKGRAVTSTEVKQFMIERLTRHGLRSRMKLQRGWSSTPIHGPSWTGMSEMSYLGLLVNAGRKGSESLWMGSADYLAFPRSLPDPEDCTVELVRKYIERYGPVTREDIVYWSFLRKDQVDVALDALKKDLVTETFHSREEYFSFGEDSGEAVQPPRVTILPEFDSLMMGYKDKSRFLFQDRVKNVFGSFAAVNRTILLDGFVAATWKRKKNRTGMMVNVSPLRLLRARERRSIDEEFANYAEYQGTKISVEFRK